MRKDGHTRPPCDLINRGGGGCCISFRHSTHSPPPRPSGSAALFMTLDLLYHTFTHLSQKLCCKFRIIMDTLGRSLTNLRLEDSIRSQHECLIAVYNGKFREAEEFYERTLEADPHNVSLMIDYAKLLYKECRYGECSTYISEKLRQCQCDHGIELSNDEARSLKIINSAAVVYTRGTLKAALRDAREAHQSLREKRMGEFRDSEVCKPI
jgi:tetratricopeptide (TPR) repeat protein